MWRVAVVLALLAAAACSGDRALDGGPTTDDGGTAADDSEPADDTVDASLVVPEGFDRVRASVTTADGDVCELCLWLAESGDQRSRGLMFVTDLGPADGMAFVYPDPHTGSFWMKNTLLPLSIAFFDPSGGFVAAFDMEPCEADPCPLYRTPSDFLVAVETVQGDLAELGMAPGSTLTIADLPCD